MTTATRIPFTLEGYRGVLVRARDLDDRLLAFRDFAPPRPGLRLTARPGRISGLRRERRLRANEACEARFTEGDMTCIADSLMKWREATPHELLERRRSFQLPTHPMKWVANHRDLREALDSTVEEECRWLRERGAGAAALYEQLLREPAERDRRARRHGPVTGTHAGLDPA